jgi:Domain of unknown function (DUF3943)
LDTEPRLPRWLLAAALAIALVAPGPVAAAEPLSWETGEGKSYVIPALEIAGFLTGLNQVDRHLIDSKEYGTDGHSIWRNLRAKPVFDRDPFSINQIGHPYQGGIYFGAARSAGLGFWEAVPYSIVGSALWEIAGETSKPSINDYVTTAVGGTFVGEALFRMASLLLEGGGETPGFWRELGAAMISPPTGFNRLVWGDRFDAVFPSRDPAIFIRLRLGAALTTNVRNADLTKDVTEQEGSADYTITYGLPGKPGYQYKRPFDYFHFELAAVPNAARVTDAIDNVTIRGLLVGRSYSPGESYRGVWGLFGSYDYLSPRIFRISTTALSLGTVAQWWLTRRIALQGSAMAGVGFGASGTVDDRDERDYHYGVAPQTQLGLRLIFGDRAMLEGTARQYYVAGIGSGAGSRSERFGQEIIGRGSVGLTVRIWGPHALGLQYLVSKRDTRAPNLRDRHQSVETVSLTYNFLGYTRFGAVEWRPDD